MLYFVAVVILALGRGGAGQEDAIERCGIKHTPLQCFSGTPRNPAKSCYEIIKNNDFAGNGVYRLAGEGERTSTCYCVFEELGECGSGPWNLVMRTDGSKATFEYNADIWNNTVTYNEESADEGIMGNTEMKLPSYSTAAVESICVGMRVGDETNWLKIPVTGTSLRDLMAEDKEILTDLGRDAWKSLINDASLQRNCNREGLNVKTRWIKTRIGIIGNEQNNCRTPDSFVAIGISDIHHKSVVKTGNFAHGRWRPDNGARKTPAIGLVLVKSP